MPSSAWGRHSGRSSWKTPRRESKPWGSSWRAGRPVRQIHAGLRARATESRRVRLALRVAHRRGEGTESNTSCGAGIGIRTGAPAWRSRWGRVSGSSGHSSGWCHDVGAPRSGCVRDLREPEPACRGPQSWARARPLVGPLGGPPIPWRSRNSDSGRGRDAAPVPEGTHLAIQQVAARPRFRMGRAPEGSDPWNAQVLTACGVRGRIRSVFVPASPRDGVVLRGQEGSGEDSRCGDACRRDGLSRRVIWARR